MSRIGKKAVPIPSGVTANVDGQKVRVKGPKGTLQVVLHDDIAAKMEDGGVKVDPRAETKRARAMWGTSRTLVANLVTGVTKGFEQRLEISGVGYRAALQGRKLQVQAGLSHDVVYDIPEGITITVPKADRDPDRRSRQADGGTGRGGNSRIPAARALQRQGHQICGRVHLPQGRQEEMTGVAHG